MTKPALILPWPPWALWQNSRHHWAQRAQAVKRARADAHWLMWERGLKLPARVRLEFTFRRGPRTSRYDVPNALAACKAYVDGMADASGVDDEHWDIVPVKGEMLRPRGGVEVRVIELPNGGRE